MPAVFDAPYNLHVHIQWLRHASPTISGASLLVGASETALRKVRLVSIKCELFSFTIPSVDAVIHTL